MTALMELKAAQADMEELITYCWQKLLGGVIRRKSVGFVERMPRSPVGKGMRRAVCGSYWLGHARNV